MPKYNPPTFRILRPINFDACLDLLRRLETDKWIFRGQRRASWSLTPTIERRALADHTTVIAKEQETLDRFFADIVMPDSMPRAAIRTPWKAPRSFDRNKFDIIYVLSIIQHYFSCTRLLDFTEDHQIGIFFALREAKNIIVLHDDYKSSEDKTLLSEFRSEPAALWCIHENEVIRSANNIIQGVLLPKIGLTDDKKDTINKVLNGDLGFDLPSAEEKRDVSSYMFRFAISQVMTRAIQEHGRLHAEGKFDDLSKFDIAPMILSIRLPLPPTVNERIIRQKGLFLAPYNMVKDSIPGPHKKITLFESNLCGSLAIPPDALVDAEIEDYQHGMALDKTHVIKLILPPAMLDSLLEYIRPLSDYGMGLRP